MLQVWERLLRRLTRFFKAKNPTEYYSNIISIDRVFVPGKDIAHYIKVPKLVFKIDEIKDLK